MKWTNQIENRVLILGTAVIMVVAFVVFLNIFVKPVYEAQISALTKQIEINNQLIERLANDPKYQISNDFGKIKPKEGSVVSLDLDNTLDVENSSTMQITSEGDTIIVPAVKQKRSFWDKLFNRK